MTLAAKLEDVRLIAMREGEHNAMVGVVKRLLNQQRSMEEISTICGSDLDEVKKSRKKAELAFCAKRVLYFVIIEWRFRGPTREKLSLGIRQRGSNFFTFLCRKSGIF